MRAFLNYYYTLLLFNICFTLATAVFAGFSFLPVIFCTAGFVFSLFAFHTFFRDQYYFYHNLGYTRRKLALKTFRYNLVPALFVLLLIKIFS